MAVLVKNRALIVAHGTLPLVLLSFLVCIDARAGESEPTKEYTLFAVGDVSLARWVPQDVHDHGIPWAIGEVAPWAREADIALVNLECVLTTRGNYHYKGEGRPYVYRTHPEIIDVLTQTGIDIATVANNHAMDYGADGLVEELQYLKAAGIAETGGGKNYQEASTPTYVQTGDIIIAFIGMEDSFSLLGATPQRAGIFHAKGFNQIKRALKGPIAEARKHADLVVFTPHWGTNWTKNPTPERRKMARWIIDQGADAILGHSSHHLHGMEVYKGKPIVYDMGSFYFDRVSQKRMRYSAAFVLTFDKGGFKKLVMHPALLKSSQTVRADPKSVATIRQLLTDLSEALQPGLAFTVEGDALVLSLKPDVPPPGRAADPALVHRSNTGRRLPDQYRNRIPDVVVDTAPEWTDGFKPIELEQGVTVLGGRSSEAVHPGHAFIVEVALKVSGPLEGAWVGMIKGVHENGEDELEWRHPIADAAWNPYQWKAGQIVIDRTLARPNQLKEGTWKLYWRLEPLRDKQGTPLMKRAAAEGEDPAYIYFDTIKIAQDGVPEGPAGISWSGFLTRPSLMDRLIARKALWSIPAAAILAILCLAFLWYRRRSKKRRRPGA